MIKVYFQIFGKKMVKELSEEEYEIMTDNQIEYFIRGKLKIDRIIREVPEDSTLTNLKNIFGMSDNRK